MSSENSKKKYTIIILFSTIFALALGATGSYYWIKNIYLKEKIEANRHARLLNDWYQQDTFVPPQNGQITERQLLAFVKVNKELVYLLERMQKQFEENSWTIAFEVIKMQPEWQASKYVALQQSILSPAQYDWISHQVILFWIHRWKQQSFELFREYGWSFDNIKPNENFMLINYELFLKYDQELNEIFDILWPERDAQNIIRIDSTFN
jgi:hypothetical protein